MMFRLGPKQEFARRAAKGYQVETASGGVECMAKVRQLWPAALIRDLDLLWGGAAGVFTSLLEDKNFHNLPALLINNAGALADILLDLSHAAFRILQKPFRLGELLLHNHRAIALGSLKRQAVLT